MEEWRKKREAFDRGDLSPAEARRYMREHRVERGFRRLHYADAARVYDIANPEEKRLLGHALDVKRRNWASKLRGQATEDQPDSTR